jgi:transposase
MDQSAFSSVGIDVGKDTFHIVALDRSGAVAHRARCTRSTVISAVTRLDADVVSMAACGGAHDLARRLREHGQPVKLLVAADVRPFVRGQKNDYNDAQAIAEAAVRPTVRTVAIKTIEQQDIQLLHRMRQRLVAQRTALINQARAMLLESGLTAVRGRKTIARKLPEMLALETAQLSAARRVMLATSYDSWRQAQDQAHQIDAQLKEVARADARCRRLLAIPGIGVLTATALVAAVGNAQEFRSGRALAAWLGLVPRQYSTGGVPRLLGISKRGNTYLRWLFIHGGRSVREHLKRDQHSWGAWLNALDSRMHPNKATVAVANKLVRVCWAVLHKGVAYLPTATNPEPTSCGASDA